MYTACFHSVYINLTQAALHNCLQKGGTFAVIVSERIIFVSRRMTH